MKFAFLKKKLDSIDAVSGAAMVLAALFVTTFFWNVAAGARGREGSFMARLREESAKRITGERVQMASLLDLEKEGRMNRALEEGERTSGRLSGNSQFHLFMARGYRGRGDNAHAVAEYRKALEANRDYSDRRSFFYIGSSLRPFIRDMKLAFATSSPGDVAVRRDLFYLERSLAGGCH